MNIRSVPFNDELNQYLKARDAARLVGVSVSFFRQRIGPEIPRHDFRPAESRKPMPRWRAQDVLRWAQARPEGA